MFTIAIAVMATHPSVVGLVQLHARYNEVRRRVGDLKEVRKDLEKMYDPFDARVQQQMKQTDAIARQKLAELEKKK